MSDSDNSQIIAEFASIQIGAYFAVVTACLIAYEYAITFSYEVELFWKRKFTVSSGLFLFNRYLPFVVNMLYAPWPSSPTSYAYRRRHSCAALFYISETLEILQYLPWAIFSALRAYVLSSRSWSLGVLVFLLSIVPIVINFASGLPFPSLSGVAIDIRAQLTMRYATAIPYPLFGCGVSVSLSDSLQQDFTIISRTALITSDLLVLAITWFATFKTSREIKHLGQTTSLSSILFRDGVVYFIVLLVMNILHLSFSLLSILLQNATANASYITILTEPITAILISRFLIDLQEANLSSAHQHSLSSLPTVSVGTLRFSRVIGSVGSALPAPGESEYSQTRVGTHTYTDSSEGAEEVGVGGGASQLAVSSTGTDDGDV